MNEIYTSLSNSIARLEEIIQSEFTVANRDSTIKRFEMTVELTWKSLQAYLREQGIVCRSPKDCLKQAFEIGIIEDDERWLQMMEDRNLTVHAYDESMADDVYERIPSYMDLFTSLVKNLQSLL